VPAAQLPANAECAVSGRTQLAYWLPGQDALLELALGFVEEELELTDF
jgi:hypothetical protein